MSYFETVQVWAQTGAAAHLSWLYKSINGIRKGPICSNVPSADMRHEVRAA